MKTVLICQSKACRKGGSERVLAAFQAIAVSDVEVVASSCLGQCGNGPMVLILPDEVWYSRVSPEEVPAVGDRHLQQGIPVRAMLYHKFHR
ncbi:MAG: (2Fe-2S) ferredoxin domain-containing protein [Oculatellaceae cyanobacterium bins.114]|nr:(2Fe-2S) ferredoxin domain-containing protein [Oculatellaceae cyanobacterium bins.114]